MSASIAVDAGGSQAGGKQNIKALALSGASASGAGNDLQSGAGRGAVVVIDVTAITGTGASLTVTIEGKDPHSGKYYTILASAALTAVGTTVLRIHPSLAAAANSVAKDLMPRDFRVSYTIAGTTPSVSAKVGVLLA